MTTEKVLVGIRMPVALRDALAKIAYQESRNLSQHIIFFLRAALDRHQLIEGQEKGTRQC